MTFQAEARDQLADDLRAGKRVGRLTLTDLITSDLAGERCRDAEEEVAGLLVREEPDRSLYIARYTERLINDWLDKQDDAIGELAAEMAEDYAQSQRPEREAA